MSLIWSSGFRTLFLWFLRSWFQADFVGLPHERADNAFGYFCPVVLVHPKVHIKVKSDCLQNWNTFQWLLSLKTSTAVIRYDGLIVYLTPSSVLSKLSKSSVYGCQILHFLPSSESSSVVASTISSFVSSSFQFRHHHLDHRLSDPEWFGSFYNLLPLTRSTLICAPLVFALNALHTWNRMVCLQFHFQTFQFLWTYLLWLIC